MCDIHVKDFQKTKLNFSEPEDVEIKINKNETSSFLRSGVGYGDFTTRPVPPDGRRYKGDNDYAYVILNEMDCLGVYPIVSNGVTKGYQVLVALTSKETVKTPTTEEQQNINFFKGAPEAVADFMANNRESLPDQFQYTPADKMITFVRSLAEHPPKKDENGNKLYLNKGKKIYDRDDEKPLMAFIPLRHKAGKAAAYNTRFYGPGDKMVDPTKYEKVGGRIQATLRLNYAYFDKRVTLNIEVDEANYIPRVGGAAPARRRLPANTAPVENDIPDNSEPSASDPALDVNPPDETYNPESDGDEPEPDYVEVKTKGGKVVRMPKEEYEKRKAAQQRKRGA